MLPSKRGRGRRESPQIFLTGHKTFKHRLRFWRVAFTPTPPFFIGDIVSLDYKHVVVTMVGMVEVIHHWHISKKSRLEERYVVDSCCNGSVPSWSEDPSH